MIWHYARNSKDWRAGNVPRNQYAAFGRRIRSEADEARMLDRVCELTAAGRSRDEIAGYLGRSKITITRYWQKLVRQGRLEKTASGRVARPRQEREQQDYEQITKSEWLASGNGEVKAWIDKMRTGGKRGTGVRDWQNLVNHMYVLCRTLDVQPSAFLVSSSETERLIGEFRQKFLAGEAKYLGKNNGAQLKSGKDTSIRQYVMAVRNFCLRNDRPLPHNLGGVVSGKKENYGAYAGVQLSDSEVRRVLDFMRDHSTHDHDWEALTAIGHETIPRPDTLFTTKNNITIRRDAIEDTVCEYGEASVYERKTDRSFDKLIFEPRALELAKRLRPGEPIIGNLSVTEAKRRFTKLLREAYASIGRISSEAVDRPAVYKKVVDGDRYYLANKSAHALRHSGCHMWLRRCDYNVVYVMSLGWEDPNMITQVYGRLSNEQRLHAGRCDYCRPPKVSVPDGNRMFCSWGHALVWYNGGRPERRAEAAA